MHQAGKSPQVGNLTTIDNTHARYGTRASCVIARSRRRKQHTTHKRFADAHQSCVVVGCATPQTDIESYRIQDALPDNFVDATDQVSSTGLRQPNRGKKIREENKEGTGTGALERSVSRDVCAGHVRFGRTNRTP